MAYKKISNLKITYEDNWLKDYVERFGDSVIASPNYQALTGNFDPLKQWFEYRGMDWHDRYLKLRELCDDLKINGQKEPIKIYADGRINNGHKRCACLLYMEEDKVDCEIVPEDYKL